MKWTKHWDLSTIPRALFLSERSRRLAAERPEPARKKVLRPCPRCGQLCGARELKYDHTCAA